MQHCHNPQRDSLCPLLLLLSFTHGAPLHQPLMCPDPLAHAYLGVVASSLCLLPPLVFVYHGADLLPTP